MAGMSDTLSHHTDCETALLPAPAQLSVLPHTVLSEDLATLKSHHLMPFYI
jgi:hypothetical protein